MTKVNFLTLSFLTLITLAAAAQNRNSDSSALQNFERKLKSSAFDDLDSFTANLEGYSKAAKDYVNDSPGSYKVLNPAELEKIKYSSRVNMLKAVMSKDFAKQNDSLRDGKVFDAIDRFDLYTKTAKEGLDSQQLGQLLHKAQTTSGNLLTKEAQLYSLNLEKIKSGLKNAKRILELDPDSLSREKENLTKNVKDPAVLVNRYIRAHNLGVLTQTAKPDESYKVETLKDIKGKFFCRVLQAGPFNFTGEDCKRNDRQVSIPPEYLNVKLLSNGVSNDVSNETHTPKSTR